MLNKEFGSFLDHLLIPRPSNPKWMSKSFGLKIELPVYGIFSPAGVRVFHAGNSVCWQEILFEMGLKHWEIALWRDIHNDSRCILCEKNLQNITQIIFVVLTSFVIVAGNLLEFKHSFRKIGLLLCHSHIKLRLRLRLSWGWYWGWGWSEFEMRLSWSLGEFELRLSWVGNEIS